MLEKKVIIDQITILEDGQMQIRQATKIMENGKELARTFYRWVVAPGDDTSTQNDRIKQVANLIHTPSVIDKYKEKQDLKV